MPSYKETLDKLIMTPAALDMCYKTKNSIDLSGWVIRKPKFIKHDKTGVESASLLLYQVNNANGEIKIETFSVMVYVKDLVEQLKKQQNILFVAIVGKLRHHYKLGDYTQATEMLTLLELDIPLANEWGKD